jgi:hypothetical protein
MARLCCVSCPPQCPLSSIRLFQYRMESLRVLPPVPMSFRQAAKTDYIEGYLIPKGTIFYIPVRLFRVVLSHSD